MNIQELTNPLALSFLARLPRPKEPGRPFSEPQAARTPRRPRRAGEPRAVYAALVLHSGLEAATQERLEALLGVSAARPVGEVRRVEEGEELLEGPEAIHLLVRGTAKALVATEESPGHQGRMFAAYRSGCWVGLERALARFVEPQVGRELREEVDASLGLRVLAAEPCEVLSIPMEAALALVAEREDFRGFVELVVGRWLPEREGWPEAVEANALLSMLDRWDRELLWQTAALRRYEGGRDGLYLKMGAPSTRCALLLSGDAQTYAEDGDGDGLPDFLGTFQAGDMIGYESLATREELGAWRRGESPQLTEEPMETPLVPRRTALYLADEALLLEFDWRVVRWLLYHHEAVWRRVCAYLLPGLVQVPSPPADIMVFLAPRGGLGTRTLAQTTALALARALRDEEDAEVALVDIRPPLDGLRVAEASQAELDAMVAGGDWQRGELERDDAASLDYCDMRIDVGGVTLRVAWCRDPSRTADLAELLRREGQVRVILVAIDDLAEIAAGGDAGGDLDQEGARRLVRGLNRLGAGVVWLTDDPYLPYDLTPEVPDVLIRAERINEAWIEREELLLHSRFEDWLRSLSREEIPPGVDPIDKVLGDLDTWERHGNRVDRLQVVNHVLRVPDDEEGARVFWQRPHAEFFAGGYPLVRVCERLTRMILKRSVGVALGGGGAWGFTQIPLLRQLVAEGLPIDYISGTSFGSLVAGMFAASGLEGLEAMLETSDPSWEEDVKALVAGTPLESLASFGVDVVKRIGPLKLALDMGSSTMSGYATSSIFDSVGLQQVVDGMMELARGDGAMPMSTTAIPFLPVGTGVAGGGQVVTYHGTVGHGARSASCLPPVYPALRLRDDRLLDGALVAFVPAEELGRIGADFIVSCNVIPPDSSLFDTGQFDLAMDQARLTATRRTLESFRGEPLPEDRAKLERRMWRRQRVELSRAVMEELAAMRGQLPEQVALKLKEVLFVRFIDAIHGFYLMSWKAGGDQSRLVANCVVDMRPGEYQVFEFWRGRQIAGDFAERLKEMRVAETIAATWRDEALWRGRPAQIFAIEKAT